MNESVRKKMALEVSIGDSEKTLKERLGTDALQVIAPRELTLQTRVSMNMSQLQSLDNERVGSYGHVGDLVISELQKRVFSLREALELPPCNASADLDELLSSTMETLHKLSPGKVPSTFSFLSSEGDQKPIFQRLQQFYKSLRDMEDTWVDSFDHKAGAFVEEKGANDAGLNGQQHSSVSSASTSALKRTDSKKNRSQGHKRKPSEDTSNLEQLCQRIFETLDDISRRARNILEMKEDNECDIAVTYEISDCSESSQPFESADSWSDLNLESKIYSQAPLTPTSVLPESTQTSVKPRIFVNAFAPHLLWLPRNLVTGSSHPNCFKNLSANIGTQGLNPKHSLTTNLDKMRREQSSNPEKSTLDPALKHSLTTHLDKTQRNQPSNLRKRINGVNMSTWENPDSKCGVQISKHNKPVGESNEPLKTITNTIQGTENSNNNTSTKLIFPPPTMVSTPPLPPPMVPTKSISLPPPMEVVTPPPAPMVPANCLTKHSLTTNLDKMQREQPSNPEKSTQGLAFKHSLIAHSNKMQREQPSNSRKRINGVNLSTCENPDSRCGVQISKNNKSVGESNQPLKIITSTIQGTDNSNNNTSTKLIFPPPTTVSTPPLPRPMVPTKSLSLPPPMEVATHPPAPMVPAKCLTKHSLTTNLDKMQKEQPSNAEESTQGLAFKHSLTAHLDKMQREQPSDSRKRINSVNLSTCENPDSKCVVQISRHNKPVGESNQTVKIITSTIQGTDNSDNNTSTKLIFPPPTMVATPPLPPPMVPIKSLSLPPPTEVATPPPAPMVPAKCLTKHSLTTNLDKMQKEQPSNPEKSTQGLAFKHSLTAHLDKMQREQPSNSRKSINGVNLSTCENPDSRCGVQISKHNKSVGESNQPLKIITSTIQGTDNSNNNTSTKLIFPPPTMVSTPPLPPPMVPTKSLSLPSPMEVATPPPAPMVPAKCLTKHSLTTNLDKMQKEQSSNAEKSTQGLAFKHSLTAHLDKMQREQPSDSRKRINGVNLSTCENPDSRCGVQISKHNKPVGESNQPLKIITSTIQEGDNSSNNTSAKLIFPPPSTVSTPTPPPPMVPAKSLPLTPPPPMVPAKSLPRPPPPPPLNASKALRPRRSNTKLKRSSQIGNLYRVLKGKVEGAGQTGKSPQACRKLVRGGGNNGTQGMAEALAEITRRSSYFRQIEEDAQRFATQIIEMKHAIECFETRDMDALLKFHNYVELHLEDLTDETQVLARFESFPTKKLEVVRAAATLYSKLSSIADHLSTLQVVPPLSRQLDKVTCYFDKIKMEVETLERIKDEEAKRFERHKIFFDFNVLIRIKESMVDVSSSCIALALEESKATKAVPNKGVGDMMDARDDSRLRRCLKMLWRVFQLSFRVYNFAGGQDERAEELTCALAREMQTYPQQYWSI